MDIMLYCSKCVDDNMGNCSVADMQIDIQYIELNPVGYYDFTCVNGHRNIIVLQEPSFELLFQSGIVLFNARYYRESVFNFAASLERFREFCIKVMIFSETQSFDLFKDMWDGMKQSERQIGAFYSLYSYLLKKSPDTAKDEKMAKLRNDVTHKGKFISIDEAKIYGEYVYDFISTTRKIMEDEIKEKWDMGCSQAVFHHQAQVHDELKKKNINTHNCVIQTMSIPTYTSISRPVSLLTFDEVIANHASEHPKFFK